MSSTEISALVSLGAQIPLVVAFVYFSLELYKRFDASLTARDTMYERRNQALVAAIEKLASHMEKLSEENGAHIAETREAIDNMRAAVGRRKQ